MRRFITWKWVGRLALAVIVLAVVTPIGYGVYARWRGQNALDRLYAHLDATDPDWDLDSLVRDTNAKLPPDDKNSFVVATTAYGQLTATFKGANVPTLPDAPPYTLLGDAERAKVSAALAGTEAATDTALTLLATPGEGGNVVVMPPNPIDRLLTKEQDLRTVAHLLSLRATLQANAGDANGAVRTTRAGLALARAMGSDPSLIGQLIRIAFGSVAVRGAERVLGLTEPEAGLAELQAELLTEAEFPRLLVGMRGERASADRIFEFVTNNPGNGEVPGVGRSLLGITRAADQAWCLEILTAYVAAVKLSPAQRVAAIRAVELPDRRDPRYILTGLLVPAIDKVCEASVRGQGELRAAAVAIACERHRRKHGGWPATLKAIDKSILAELPVDPADGQPLRYKRLPDGVVVYTIGPDGVDQGGLLDSTGPRDKRDWGVRLYDVDKRRQPAPPPEPAEVPDEEAP